MIRIEGGHLIFTASDEITIQRWSKYFKIPQADMETLLEKAIGEFMAQRKKKK